MTDSTFTHACTPLHENLKTEPSLRTCTHLLRGSLFHGNLKKSSTAFTMMKLIFVLLLLVPSVKGRQHFFALPQAVGGVQVTSCEAEVESPPLP